MAKLLTDIYDNVKILFLWLTYIYISSLHDPQHAYLDLYVINNEYKHDGPPTYPRFAEIRNTPLLDGDSSEYFGSIMRFTIQTGSTPPVFIPRVVIQRSDTPLEFQPSRSKLAQNKTIYSVSLKYNYMGVDYVQTTPILYTPEDKTAPFQLRPIIFKIFRASTTTCIITNTSLTW